MVVPTFTATKEQIQYAKNAVSQSLKLGFKNKMLSKQTDKKSIELMRFRGFLGELLFSAAYELEPPKNCYGLNGQDFGVDFCVNGYNVDIKTVGLNTLPTNAKNVNYSLALSMINAKKSKTNIYYFVAIAPYNDTFKAYFFGSTSREILQTKSIGTYYKAGQTITYGKNISTVKSDCLKLNISELQPTKISAYLAKMPNFELINL